MPALAPPPPAPSPGPRTRGGTATGSPCTACRAWRIAESPAPSCLQRLRPHPRPKSPSPVPRLHPECGQRNQRPLPESASLESSASLPDPYSSQKTVRSRSLAIGGGERRSRWAKRMPTHSAHKARGPNARGRAPGRSLAMRDHPRDSAQTIPPVQIRADASASASKGQAIRADCLTDSGSTSLSH
jgi:hypothetical protein